VTCSPRRLAILAAPAVVLVALAADTAWSQCAVGRHYVEVVLDDTGTIQATGQKLGAFNCWMQTSPAADKTLCAEANSTAHVFGIAVVNNCAFDVEASIRLRGGGSLNFHNTECANVGSGGKELRRQFVSPGGSLPAVCVTDTHPPGTQRRSRQYDVIASKVRIEGNESPIAPPVTFDPEIVLDRSGGFQRFKVLLIGAVSALVALLIGLFLGRRFARHAS
jgi:hypothetical protein